MCMRGRGIAQVLAQAGIRVRMHDVSPEVLRAGREAALAGIAKLEAKGKLPADRAEAARAGLAAAPHLASAAAGADLAIEAVPESLALKRALLAEVEPLLAP